MTLQQALNCSQNWFDIFYCFDTYTQTFLSNFHLSVIDSDCHSIHVLKMYMLFITCFYFCSNTTHYTPDLIYVWDLESLLTARWQHATIKSLKHYTLHIWSHWTHYFWVSGWLGWQPGSRGLDKAATFRLTTWLYGMLWMCQKTIRIMPHNQWGNEIKAQNIS